MGERTGPDLNLAGMLDYAWGLPMDERHKISVNAVHKFGGKAMADTRLVVDTIVRARRNGGQHIVVVSALAGVTAQLKDVLRRRDANGLIPIVEQHVTHANSVGVEGEVLERYGQDMLNLFFPLVEDGTTKHDVLAFGERASSKLLEVCLIQRGIKAEAVDAPEFLRTGSYRPGGPEIIWDQTENRGQRLFKQKLHDGIQPIVTGYIARVIGGGGIVTLDDNGTDHTASILAKILRAKEVIFYKDVDGIFEADPNKDPSARFISEMTFADAHQMAQDGIEVLHPKAMEPLLGTDTVAIIRNINKPDHPGTRISQILAV